MNYLKIALRFYINSSIHVALSVYCLLNITYVYWGFTQKEELSNFLFFGTIIAYNFIKYFEVSKLHYSGSIKNLKQIQFFSFCCLLFFCYYLLQLNLKTILFIIPLGIITVLYAVPFIEGFRKNLRSISYLKILIVALVWSSLTVVFPIYDYGINIENKGTLILMTAQRFLLIFVFVLPFDIRDMNYDAASLRTLPQKIGLRATKRVGLLVLILCLVLELIISNDPKFLKCFFVVFITTLVLLMRASEKQSFFYSSFIVEAIPIIWFIILTV